MNKKSTDIRTLKSLSTPQRYTISDTRGLQLFVKNAESKFWVFRFTFEGKRYDSGIGSFPAVTLADARTKVLKMRGMILNGINPIEAKKASRTATKSKEKPKVTFQKYALEYVDTMTIQWRNTKHAAQWVNTLTTYAFPVLGKLPLEEIKTEHILEILKPIWSTKNETAGRLRGRIERIISSAITMGLRTSANPATWKDHLQNILPSIKRTSKHHSALPYEEIPAFMEHLMANDSMTSLALQFTLLNISRTGEVRLAKRTEVVNGMWSIPANRMKCNVLHEVPLCPRSLELIQLAIEQAPYSEYIFSNKGKNLSSMAMLMMARRYKAGLTVHGGRSSFRDWAADTTDHSSDTAELALAHRIGSPTERAYRRGTMLEKRRLLLLDWEAYCLSKAKA